MTALRVMVADNAPTRLGVRMALGANPTSVHRLILGEAASLVGAGAVLGIAGSLASARLLRGLFYGIRAWDLPMLAVVAFVLMVAALLASHIPARRARKVEPMVVLRYE